MHKIYGEPIIYKQVQLKNTCICH